MNGDAGPVTRLDRRASTRGRLEHRRRAETLLHFGRTESLPHLAGLDGLRGLAVAAVVVFHSGLDVLPGGYLGVSLFFTLSGFLITSLLVSEFNHRGSIDLRAFWGRRFRRLLPAAWLTLIAVGIAAVLLDDVAPGLRGDLWASAANVANWRFLASGNSYAELFSNPSPLLHFWSLAIEEQFYFVFPLVFSGLWVACRGRRAIAAWVMFIASAASFALPMAADLSVDRTYYGTDTRAGELLIGATLALVINGDAVRRLLVRRWWWKTITASAGLIALSLAVTMWATVQQGDPRLQSGALAVVALSTVVLIVASITPAGPVYHLTLMPPLRWLGRVSYGVYLFHWPVLVWSGADRSGTNHVARFVVAMIAVGILAELSLRLFETPIRRRLATPLPAKALAGMAALALVVGPVGLTDRVDAAQEVVAGLDDAALSFSGPPNGRDDVSVLGAVERRGDAPIIPQTAPPLVGNAPPGGSSTDVAGIADAPVVSFFGDSITLSLAMTIGYWNATARELVDGRGVAMLGCGVIPGGSFRFDRIRSMPQECDNWADSWPFVVRAAGTDVAVVQSCQWETVERRYPGMESFVAPGDPAADDAITGGYLAAVDVLIGAGADVVVWVKCPYFSTVNGVRRLEPGLLDSRDPARTDRLNQLIENVAMQRPGLVEVMAWNDVVNARVDDSTWRPDGSHYQWKADVGIAAQFGPDLVDIIDRARARGTR